MEVTLLCGIGGSVLVPRQSAVAGRHAGAAFRSCGHAITAWGTYGSLIQRISVGALGALLASTLVIVATSRGHCRRQADRGSVISCRHSSVESCCSCGYNHQTMQTASQTLPGQIFKYSTIAAGKATAELRPEVLTAVGCSIALASAVGGQASTAFLTAGSVPAHVVGGNCANHARVSDDTSGRVPCGLAPIA